MNRATYLALPHPQPGHRVYSMSAIKAFKRCPKSFWFNYIKGLQKIVVPDVVENGTSFHKIAQAYAEIKRDNLGLEGLTAFQNTFQQDPMFQVFAAWFSRRAVDEFSDMEIISVEEPWYLQVHYNVWIRITPDLVYVKDGWIYIRDYKTFSKAPSDPDASLNFQAKLYIGIVGMYQKAQFEHYYVRQDLYHTGKMSNIRWTAEESYFCEPLKISQQEAIRELVYTQRLVEYLEYLHLDGTPYDYYHVDHAGTSPFTCHTCFFKDVCKAESEVGPDRFDELDVASMGYTTERNEHNTISIPDPAPAFTLK